MDRARMLMGLLAGAVLLTQGCATRAFVRARLEELRRSVSQDTDRLQTDLEEIRSSTQDALAQADLASGQAGEARDLALGKAGFQEAAHYVVFFASNSSVLGERAALILDEVVGEVQAHPEYLIDVSGFADRTGSAGYNLVLGQRRAEAVLRYLSLRTPSMLSRYSSVSYGEDGSVGDQTTESGRARNRRVVVSLVTRTRTPEAVTRSGGSSPGTALMGVAGGP